MQVTLWFAWAIAMALLLSAAVRGEPKAAEAAGLPKIRHVFTIVLENKGYTKTFDPKSPAPYLSKVLVRQGALIQKYYGIAHFSLPNYIAMISGQGPNPKTQGDCEEFIEFTKKETSPNPGTDDQLIGNGCVYPAEIKTIVNQLTDANPKLSWRAYMEDLGNDVTMERRICGYPKIGERDPTQNAASRKSYPPAEYDDQYATKHNPFFYFHSIIDAPEICTNVVPLSMLASDLKAVATTPNYVFITPNLCNDGHDEPCVDGKPGGLVSADGFLRHWVKKIKAAPAFKLDGLLIITFDEAGIAGPDRHNKFYGEYWNGKSDAEAFDACCNEQPGPNYSEQDTISGARSLGPGIGGPGGGRVGAVLLSRFIRPGTISNVSYNHYSMLRTLEDLFGLRHLGYSAHPELRRFGPDVFTRPGG